MTSISDEYLERFEDDGFNEFDESLTHPA